MIRSDLGDHASLAETGLNKTGPELLDDIRGQLSAGYAVQFGLLRGQVAIDELVNEGDSVEGLKRYVPGADQSTDIDIPATLSGDGTHSRRPSDDVDVTTVRIFADIPERLTHTTGRATLFDAARYAVAMSLGIAEKASAGVSVTLAKDGMVGTVLDGSPQDGYVAMEAIDQGTSVAMRPADGPDSSLEQALADIEAESNFHDDVVLVLSDLLSGYDAESDTFNWEATLDRLHMGLGDRLLVGQLRSTSQLQLPVGIARGLSLEDLRLVRKNAQQLLAKKTTRLAAILQSIRHNVIDVTSDEGVKSQIGNFLIG